jgi:hypothetical protein
MHCTILFGRDFAYPLENGVRQMGIFQPRIYGMQNNIELSTHPILFLIKPNIRMKKFHGEINGFGLASRYSFDYPTALLNLFQRDGIGGLLADDPDIGKVPHLFVFQGEWLVTKKLPHYSFTGKMGMSICPGCNLDSRHLIDYDLIYPRMALYNYGMGVNMGIDLDYIYLEKIVIKADVDIFFIPHEKMFLEHKLLFSYNLTKKYTLTAGYKYSYGYYPFNIEKGLWNLFPLLDISWQWSR